jgi:hypothetical protein
VLAFALEPADMLPGVEFEPHPLDQVKRASASLRGRRERKIAGAQRFGAHSGTFLSACTGFHNMRAKELLEEILCSCGNWIRTRREFCSLG